MAELLKEISNVSLAYIVMIFLMLLFYMVVAGIAYTNISDLVTASNGPCGTDLDTKCGGVMGSRLNSAFLASKVTLGVAGVTILMLIFGTFVQMRRK
jgi:hypothetical protein